jgi:plasmid stabilization system protein ParE
MAALKKRQVLITQRVFHQLNEVADWIAERASDTAERWFNEFAARVQSLDTTASQCPLARESRRLPFELREMLFGKQRQWRVLFTVRGDDVLVMTVRHASQSDVTLDDLMGGES